MTGQKKFQMKDAWNGFVISFELEQEADIIYYPVETVSDSETGIEKSFQEMCCLLLWPVEVPALSDWSIDFKVLVYD